MRDWWISANQPEPFDPGKRQLSRVTYLLLAKFETNYFSFIQQVLRGNWGVGEQSHSAANAKPVDII